MDEAIAAIAGGHVDDALALTPRFASRPSVFVGLLARMMQSSRDALILFVIDAVEREPSLMMRRFAGKTLLHFASGAGCLGVVESLLRLGADPSARDSGGHTPLYRVGTNAGRTPGRRSFGRWCHAGGDVNAHGGSHGRPAAYGREAGIHGDWEALLDCGAAAGQRYQGRRAPSTCLELPQERRCRGCYPNAAHSSESRRLSRLLVCNAVSTSIK